MLAFNAGWVKDRGAFVVGVGMTDVNLNVMLYEDRPLHLRSEHVKVPDPGFSLAVIAAQDTDGIARRLKAHFNEAIGEGCPPLLQQAPLLRQNGLSVVVLAGKGGRGVYILGLDAANYRALRQGDTLSFRSRFVSGGPGTSVEFMLFWGTSHEVMEENFHAAGLMKPQGPTPKDRAARRRDERKRGK